MLLDDPALCTLLGIETHVGTVLQMIEEGSSMREAQASMTILLDISGISSQSRSETRFSSS